MIIDPINFVSTLIINDQKFELRNIIEVCQGGPNIGKLFINDQSYFNDTWFGGPLLANNENIYLTIRHKGFFLNGFKLCQINIDKKSLTILNVSSDIIWITKVDDENLYFRTSLSEESEEKSYCIN